MEEQTKQKNMQNDKTNSNKSMQRQEILEGVKRGLPVVLGYLPLGFAFGVLAVKSGITPLLAFIMSITVYAGSGQFIAASMVGMGAPILTIAIANFLINLRYFLMVSSLLQYIKKLSFIKKVFFAAEITDESFAVHYINFKKEDEEHKRKILAKEIDANSEIERASELTLFATNLTSHGGWIFGSLLGIVSGELLTDIRPYGLDYALPAMFIALLVPLCFERIQCIVALLGALLLVLCVSLGFGKYALIIAAIIAASVGAYLEIRREKNDSIPLEQQENLDRI